MPTAKKLPSGSWRVRVFSHYEYTDGHKKPVYESFTCPDPSKAGKKEAERMAAEWQYEHSRRSKDKTIPEAVRDYIDARSGVLSPSTIRGYESYLKHHICELSDISVRYPDESRMQIWVSQLSVNHKPKTVKEIVSLVSASYKMATGKDLHLALPAPQHPELHTPTDAEIQALLEHVRGTDLEIAICLAAFCSLRRGEICALARDDFRDGMVYVNKSMIRMPDGTWKIKTPKTPESNRAVPVPEQLMALIEGKTGRIMDCHPDALSNRFKRAVKYAIKHCDAEHFRFHDLRHYYASTAHYLGVPDAYIMLNGGWSSDSMMKRVYREALQDKRKEENDKIAAHYATIYDTTADGTA